MRTRLLDGVTSEKMHCRIQFDSDKQVFVNIPYNVENCSFATDAEVELFNDDLNGCLCIDYSCQCLSP